METIDEMFDLSKIEALIEQRLMDLGVVLSKAGYLLANNYNIRATGDFMDKIGYAVNKEGNVWGLNIGSNVKYEPYILGGKQPSWTPLEPLKAWVEQKGLSWADKKTGKELSITQMAYMVRNKIKREGVKERNIVQEVYQTHEAFIYQKIEEIIRELEI